MTGLPRLALTIPEAAAACGLSDATIRRAIRAGDLRAKTSAGRGRKQVVLVKALEEWLEGMADA